MTLIINFDHAFGVFKHRYVIKFDGLSTYLQQFDHVHVCVFDVDMDDVDDVTSSRCRIGPMAEWKQPNLMGFPKSL